MFLKKLFKANALMHLVTFSYKCFYTQVCFGCYTPNVSMNINLLKKKTIKHFEILVGVITKVGHTGGCWR